MLNPLLMNDWPIRKFLAAVGAVLLTMWALVNLQAAGVEIPILRPAVALVFLAYLPGAVILRILKLHSISGIEALLYSVGLSLAFVMFTGALTNAVFPYFGVSMPISLMPLMISFTALISVLCVIAYARDKAFSAPAYIDIKGILSPPVLFLLLLPLISILGTQLVNSYDYSLLYSTNTLLMALIVMIAFSVLLIGFNRFIPESIYPLAIFTLGLSLLLYRTLISLYISGMDTHEEYYAANMVMLTGKWDASVLSMLNGMLSVTILAPVISSLATLDLTWVFKIVYPSSLALVPLGMYEATRKQSDRRTAFFACFFYVAVYHFYNGLPNIMRQQIGTIFLVLLVLLMVKGVYAAKKASLFVVFGAALIVSHYTLSYIYAGYAIVTWLALLIAKNGSVSRMWNWLRSKIERVSNSDPDEEYSQPKTTAGAISPIFTGLFVALLLTWYMFTSGSGIIKGLVGLGSRMVTNVSRDFLNPTTSEGIRMLTKVPTLGLLYSIGDIMFYVNQGLIITGVFILLWRFRKASFEREYLAFAILSLVVLGIGVLIPSIFYDISRLYHMMLVVLAPAFVLGGLAVLDLAGRFAARLTINSLGGRKRPLPAFAILSVYLIIFFLYQTGFVYELTNQNWGSYSLGRARLEENADAQTMAAMRGFYLPPQDAMGAEWLSENMDNPAKVYATYYGSQVQSLTSYGMLYSTTDPHNKVPPLTPSTAAIPERDYIYLRYVNVIDGIGTTYRNVERTYGTFDMAELAPLLDKENKIYSNGGSEIYR